MMEAKGIRPYKTVGVAAGLGVSWYVYFLGGVFSSLFITLVLITIMVTGALQTGRGARGLPHLDDHPRRLLRRAGSAAT